MKRKRINTDSYRRKKILRTIARWVLASIVITGFIYAMNRPYFFIKDIKILGNQSLQTQDITDVVETYMTGSWLGIIPRKNLFFYGEAGLVNTLREHFPKIYNLDMSTHGSELDIIISERDAHSLWCVDRIYESPFDEECYFADQNGYWYAQAPYFSDNVLTKIYLDPRVDSIILGDRFLNNTSFDELFSFVDALKKEHHINIQKIIFRPQGDVEIRSVQLKEQVYTKPYIIWFNTKDSFERIYRNLGIVFTQDQFMQEFKRDPQNLQSIDVRFDGRIFYKFNPPTAMGS
jgi:hypothetical protein